jgi:hypothetical protein
MKYISKFRRTFQQPYAARGQIATDMQVESKNSGDTGAVHYGELETDLSGQRIKSCRLAYGKD